MCPKPKQVFALAALVAAAGCGRSEFVPLTGNVTLDGKPISAAVITFHSQSGGPSGYGSVQPDGRYFAKTGSREGLKPGKYQISVIAHEPLINVNKVKPEFLKPLAPARYSSPKTSGLSYVLTESGGTFNIALDSR